MIAIQTQNDKACPRFYCDACNRPILQACKAVAYWLDDHPKDVKYLHAGRCFHVFAGHMNAVKENTVTLDQFILQICKNSGYDASAARKRNQLMEGIQ